MRRSAVRAASLSVALSVLGACVPPSVGSLVGRDDGLSKPSDTIRTGLTADEMLEAEPYGMRVQWIAWDSHFRDTELRVGDRIIGVDGQRYTVEGRRPGGGRAVGLYGEPGVWQERGARDGQRVKLLVWRKGKTLEVEGKLRADRFYFTRERRRALAPGGPEPLVKDGFGSSWSQWYEAFVKRGKRVLDGGWRRGTFNNRRLLEQHRADKERVDALVARYPGAFADAVAGDWQRIHDSLLGAEHTITAADLEYRELGEIRARKIAAIAVEARDGFLAARRGRIVDAFPAVDPIEGDLAAAAGKVVVLPLMGRRSWISEAGHGYLYAGDRRKGLYFIDSRSKEFVRVLEAEYRYQQLVSPKLDQSYRIIGEIQREPSMRVVGSVAVAGLKVKPLAVTVGDQLFIDLTRGARATFAGEDSLSSPGVATVADRASPRQVMEAWVVALKSGNKDAWKHLYAGWDVAFYFGGRIDYRPHYWARVRDSDWVRARRVILDKVYDVNVVDVGLVRTIVRGDEFDGAPHIEEVLVEIEHIGEFDEGYRPFKDVNVHRVWSLQRRNGGPWRIVTRRAI